LGGIVGGNASVLLSLCLGLGLSLLFLLQLSSFQFFLFPLSGLMLRFAASFPIPALSHYIRRCPHTTWWL
jgi:hypothetical protein